MNNYLKTLFNIIKYNLKILITFELLYKLIISLIFIPTAVAGFNLTMRLTGFRYLTIENIGKFLLNPITIIMLILIITFLTIVTMLEISSLIIIFDESYHQQKIKLNELVKLVINKFRQIFKLKNISVAFLVLFLIPFLNICTGSNVISSIKIPEFIMDYINNNGKLIAAYLIIILFLTSILIRWLYSLHYMVIEGSSFKKAKKQSKKLIKNNHIKDLLRILLVQFILALVYVIFLIIGVIVLSLIIKLLSTFVLIESFLVTIVSLFAIIFLIVFNGISNSISFAVLSTLFYKHKIEKNEEIKYIKHEPKIEAKKTSKVFKRVITIVTSLTIIGGTILSYQIISGKVDMNIDFTPEIEVTGHRGASFKYPENTMSSFKGAKELGADWIELDVQQTKDRQIVVSHDTNLFRITGVNKDIIDMNYDDISKLDAGSFKGKEFKGEKMPLLSEVLKFAKENNVRLNIELKPTGKEIEFEKQVIDLIKEYHFEDKCVVTSQVYNVLENIKKITDDIKTVYVMSIAIGNITDLKYADAFSVEATNINHKLVNKVHNDGKEIYAWTANTDESINEMIDMEVDNIITDNIELCKEILEERKNSDLINEILRIL